MTDGADAQWDLARRMLSQEAGGDSDPSQMADALNRVYRKLRHRLERVVGDLGVRAMVRRSVAVTRARFPFLVAEPVPDDDECLKGLRESLRGQDPAVATEALISLLANLLALLLAMLGQNLTCVLLREALPDAEIP